MRIHKFFLLPCVLLLFSRADAYFGYGLMRCLFTSKDDVVYLAQLYFNKVLQGEYNSTLGKYVGYTKKAQELADELNKSESFLEQEKENEMKCRSHVSLAFELSKPVEPTVRLRSVKAAGSKHPGMLICSAYSFYPRQIKLTWLKDGKEATSEVMSTDELPNGNWLYQIHSYLEFKPKPGEKISCMVEHGSLREPKFYDWDPTPESEKNKIAIGAAGLVLGLVIFLAGLFLYKKTSRGRMLVPTS